MIEFDYTVASEDFVPVMRTIVVNCVSATEEECIDMVDIMTIPDELVEGTETFTVTLSSTDEFVRFFNQTATIQILDNDCKCRTNDSYNTPCCITGVYKYLA